MTEEEQKVLDLSHLSEKDYQAHRRQYVQDLHAWRDHGRVATKWKVNVKFKCIDRDGNTSEWDTDEWDSIWPINCWTFLCYKMKWKVPPTYDFESLTIVEHGRTRDGMHDALLMSHCWLTWIFRSKYDLNVDYFM